MGFYTNAIATVTSLLTRYGQKVTVCRILQDAPYDPLQPQLTPLRLFDTEVTVAAVIPLSDSIVRSFDSLLLQDTLARQSFRYLLMAGLKTFILQPGDFILTGEGAYKVIKFGEINPAGTGVILYEVGCTLDLSFVVPTSDELGLVLTTELGNPFITQEGDVLITQANN